MSPPWFCPSAPASTFHGCYNVTNGDYYTAKTKGDAFDTIVETSGIDDAKLDDLVDSQLLEESREMIELASVGYSDFDLESYREGHLSPVIFGSALKDLDQPPCLISSRISRPCHARPDNRTHGLTRREKGFRLRLQSAGQYGFPTIATAWPSCVSARATSNAA